VDHSSRIRDEALCFTRSRLLTPGPLSTARRWLGLHPGAPCRRLHVLSYRRQHVRTRKRRATQHGGEGPGTRSRVGRSRWAGWPSWVGGARWVVDGDGAGRRSSDVHTQPSAGHGLPDCKSPSSHPCPHPGRESCTPRHARRSVCEEKLHRAGAQAAKSSVNCLCQPSSVPMICSHGRPALSWRCGVAVPKATHSHAIALSTPGGLPAPPWGCCCCCCCPAPSPSLNCPRTTKITRDRP